MVHGLFTSLAVYALTIAPPLAVSHRVVLYDLRGHGLSERRDEGYTPEMLARDLIDLMDERGIPRAGIVGYSYGGAVALYAALHYPERISRLALIDAMLLEDNGARETHIDTDAGRRGPSARKTHCVFSEVGWELATTLGKRRPLRDNGVDEVDTREGEAVAEDASVPALSDEVIRDYTASTGIPVTEANLERLRSIARHFLEPERFQAALRANQQLFDELSRKELTIPALLIYGKQSPYRDRGRILASCIPSATMRLIKGDHNLPVLQGERIARSFRDFFDPAQHRRGGKGAT
jgi:pimeloyl-ACP methyl ester carboxylesterase